MAPQAHTLKDAQIAKAATLATSKISGSKGKNADAFIRAFYANILEDDILDTEPEDLYGAALALMQFASTRKPGTPKVRAYNPSFDAEGWRSPHTVVEIINDDMPFLVDSVATELNRMNLMVHLVIHPTFLVDRDAAGALQALRPGRNGSTQSAPESFMQIQVDEQTGRDALAEIERNLERVLADVRATVEDWPAMRERAQDAVREITDLSGPLTEDMAEETASFLQWLHDDHFTFVGYREFAIKHRGGKTSIALEPDSGLGVLQEDSVAVFDGLRRRGEMPPEVRTFLESAEPLLITKSSLRSTVHRPTPLDAIVVKRFDEKGKVVGERLFVGLFTSVAYSMSPRRIPLLRRKVDEVLSHSGFDPGSHNGKALLHVLSHFPRDELFQTDAAALQHFGLGIINLQERQRIALFVRHDPFERFVSAFVYVPRDRYDPDLGRRFAAILATVFDGEVTGQQAHFGDEPLGRLHFTIATKPGAIPDYEIREIEVRLREAGRSWGDRLHESLLDQHGEETGNRLHRRYAGAFPSAYREQTSAPTAAFDIGKIEGALDGDPFAINLYHPIEADPSELRLKIYKAGEELSLSDILPVLENMGLKVMTEIPYEVVPAGAGETVRIHDFGLVTRDGGGVDFSAIRDGFHTSLARIWAGEMEDDGYNRLVLGAGLDWREVSILRAYSRYLRQARIPFSQIYMADTLSRNGALAGLIVDLFKARFDPAYEGKRQVDEIRNLERIEQALEAVSNLDEDRIIRRFVNLVQVTLRTNFFQLDADGEPKPFLSFKLDSVAVEGLPPPWPLREIFVYSPRFEGVHLRFGFVARGGLRWSDRLEDFRTEVLGLAKAQQVKNAVIVPVGSKGGFVLKQAPPPSDRDAFLAEGVAVYKTFVGAMLEITDNLDGEKVVPPPGVLRKDEDDPYLVVAADKGTATFSDYANEVACEKGYWLGDAFASGGSAGYDHKKIAITARGAWESVKRHFREMGRDIQAEDFTVVGCGDMSGDVFGNGMLLSEHIRMVGAFNHLHIFIDPDPDPAKSFAERKRLFETPRSSWVDYDSALIAKGGGVFERSAKSLDITPEMKKLFGITASKLPPNELINAMLMAEVDMLWFGGIGTYIKSSHEDHNDVGDRANDPLRVDGRELRCKVVGEGANLGVTQLGRIEFAQAGGRINTDFIDNSAGVDCSDHEVNIKVALGDVVQRGDMTTKQRDTLLARMTDDVANLVLRGNYQQSQALSIAGSHSYRALGRQQRMIRALERAGLLDRALEFLPDDEEIADRQSARQGLAQPEISILLSYAKNTTYQQLLESDLPDDPMLAEDLVRYFPAPMRKAHKNAIKRHRLRREIIATVVTNSMINRAGPTFVTEMQDRTGLDASEIARAYTIVREAFGLRPIWKAIEALDNTVPAEAQIQMLVETGRTVERMTAWFLHNGRHPLDIRAHIDEFRPGVETLRDNLESLMAPDQLADTRERAVRFSAPGVPEDLAQSIGRLKALSTACDIVRLAQTADRPVEAVGETYFLLGSRFRLDWLRHNANNMAPENSWYQLALGAIIEDLWGTQGELTGKVLTNGQAGAAAVEDWAGTRREAVTRVVSIVEELEQHGTVDLAMLTVANRELRALAAL
jgi:glutamate dehydrogenase